MLTLFGNRGIFGTAQLVGPHASAYGRVGVLSHSMGGEGRCEPRGAPGDLVVPIPGVTTSPSSEGGDTVCTVNTHDWHKSYTPTVSGEKGPRFQGSRKHECCHSSAGRCPDEILINPFTVSANDQVAEPGNLEPDGRHDNEENRSAAT